MSDRSAGVALAELQNLCRNLQERQWWEKYITDRDYEKFCDACTKCQTELFDRSREANMNQRNDEELKRLTWGLKELVPEDRLDDFDDVCEKLLGVGWDCP